MSERAAPVGRIRRILWEYVEVRFYKRVTQLHFSHDQGPSLIETWSRLAGETIDVRRSNRRYVQLNRQEDPIELMAALGDDGWELVGSTTVQLALRYAFKRVRSS